MRRRRAWMLAAGALLMALPGPWARAASPSLEAAIKASYLYKLAPFVDWPEAALPNAAAPFVICVVGDDPFGPMLERAVAGQKVGARPIAVSRLAAADRAMPCQIAYLGGSRAQPVKEALRVLRGAPVLTVTDNQPTPGMVDFVIANDRVRFRIDAEAAGENGLTISSKLLGLAVTVNARKASGPSQ